MGSLRKIEASEKLAIGLAKLVREELPDLRPADFGLLVEVFFILQRGSHEARDSLLRHLEILHRLYPGEDGEGGLYEKT